MSGHTRNRNRGSGRKSRTITTKMNSGLGLNIEVCIAGKTPRLESDTDLKSSRTERGRLQTGKLSAKDNN